MDPSNLKFTPLRISTLVTTGHLGTTLNLGKLFEQFHLYAIPIGYPDEGFLKIEYGERKQLVILLVIFFQNERYQKIRSLINPQLLSVNIKKIRLVLKK